MHSARRAITLMAAFAGFSCFAGIANADREKDAIQLGPRPFYLVEGMDESPLKRTLMQCKDGPFRRTDFSIGHRGAALQFPEHTKESYEAGARMGAGIVECDVTFTKHGDLVCRHAQNDLHTTTNILLTALASTCIKPFTPATFDFDGKMLTPATAECRTSELTLDEFKSLRGKMDAFNPAARSVEEFVGGTASWRTDLYTGRGTLMTLRESIELNEKNGVKHTPELKVGDATSIANIFGGQDRYAQKLADELQQAGVKPHDAWPQSFNVNDVLYWIKNTPYRRQAVFLVDYDADKNNILLFDTTGAAIRKDSDMYKALDVLAREIKILGIFSDWPATVTYYANCMGLK